MSCLVYGTYTNTIHLFYNIDCSFSFDTSENVFLDFIRINNPPLMNQLEALVKVLNAKDSEASECNSQSEQPEFRLDSKFIQAILYGIPLKRDSKSGDACMKHNQSENSEARLHS